MIVAFNWYCLSYGDLIRLHIDVKETTPISI